MDLQTWAHTPPSNLHTGEHGQRPPSLRCGPRPLAGAPVTRDRDDGGRRLLLPLDTQVSRTAMPHPLDQQASNLPDPPGPNPRARHQGCHPPAPIATRLAAPSRVDTGGKWGAPTYQGRKHHGLGHAALTWHAPPPPLARGGPTGCSGMMRDPPPHVGPLNPALSHQPGPEPPLPDWVASPPPLAPRKGRRRYTQPGRDTR